MSKKAWDLPWSSNDHRQGKSHSKGILSQGKFPCNGSCAADRDFLRATAFFGHGCVPTSGVCAGKGQKDRQCHSSLIPAERIERTILLIRDQKVILDSDLAEIYGVTPKRLNEQVRRNIDRFPKGFAFVLTRED